jgi:hypothetical protein
MEKESLVKKRCHLASISQSRLSMEDEPEKKNSPVWNDIEGGVKTESSNHPNVIDQCTVFFVKEAYNDIVLFLALLAKVVSLNPEVSIMPFSAKPGKYEDELIAILKPYRGIIIAVNAAPSERAKKELPNLRGFVGPNEKEMAEMAAENLLSSHRVKKIIIPNDKPNLGGYQERALKIREIAALYNVESVEEVYFNPDDEKTFEFVPEEGTAIIGLGPMGTKFALRVRENYPDRIVGITTMDMDEVTKEAIKANILTSVIQNPHEQGVRAVQMAVDILEGKTTSTAYKTLFCRAKFISTVLLIALHNTFLEKTHCQCNVSRRL